MIRTRSGETREVRVPAGLHCCSIRAELVALRAALEALIGLPEETGPVVVCLDSQAALLTLGAPC